MKHRVVTHGTCSSAINYELTDGIIHNLRFEGGCDGNLKAMARLVEGLPVADVVQRLQGITCGAKKTSCGDQLARALLSQLGTRNA